MSDSDVYRRQILTSEVDPRTEIVNTCTEHMYRIHVQLYIRPWWYRLLGPCSFLHQTNEIVVHPVV